ncbi:MAG: hypothetical protein AB7K67_06200 [Hyphomicrobiaceae bacterium]
MKDIDHSLSGRRRDAPDPNARGRVMSMESLANAAKAAGFAMAVSDELLDQSEADLKAGTLRTRAEVDRLSAPLTRTAPAVIRQPSTAEWIKGMLGFSGRSGQPA